MAQAVHSPRDYAASGGNQAETPATVATTPASVADLGIEEAREVEDADVPAFAAASAGVSGAFISPRFSSEPMSPSPDPAEGKAESETRETQVVHEYQSVTPVEGEGRVTGREDGPGEASAAGGTATPSSASSTPSSADGAARSPSARSGPVASSVEMDTDAAMKASTGAPGPESRRAASPSVEDAAEFKAKDDGLTQRTSPAAASAAPAEEKVESDYGAVLAVLSERKAEESKGEAAETDSDSDGETGSRNGSDGKAPEGESKYEDVDTRGRLGRKAPPALQATTPREVVADVSVPTHRMNLSRCSYVTIRDAARSIGWSTSNKPWTESKRWTIMWSDHGCLSNEELSTFTRRQRLNHFPGMVELCCKCSLARHLNRMKREFPSLYTFHPRSWILPAERSNLESYWSSRQRAISARAAAVRAEEKKRQRRRKRRIKAGRAVPEEPSAGASKPRSAQPMLIVKPDDGCKGIGIFLTSDPTKIPEEKNVVVQEYVPRPFLINGHKFDLRLYVLVTSCHPGLRAFMYREGLTRFATHKYSPPNPDNLKDTYMHLTNYAINKKNRKFEDDWSDGEGSDEPSVDGTDAAGGAGRDPLKEMSGSRWSLSALMTWFDRHGIDSEKVRDSCKDVVVKTLLAIRPRIHFLYRSCFKEASDEGYRCFELLGLDILLDADLRPIVIEVNQSPSFHQDHPLDEAIKGPLLRDTLNLAAAMPAHKPAVSPIVSMGTKVEGAAAASDSRADGGGQAEVERESPEAAWRRAYEDANCGKFERIFPCDDPDLTAAYAPANAYTPSLLKETSAAAQKRAEAQSRRKMMEQNAKWERMLREGGAAARQAMRERAEHEVAAKREAKRVREAEYREMMARRRERDGQPPLRERRAQRSPRDEGDASSHSLGGSRRGSPRTHSARAGARGATAAGWSDSGTSPRSSGTDSSRATPTTEDARRAQRLAVAAQSRRHDPPEVAAAPTQGDGGGAGAVAPPQAPLRVSSTLWYDQASRRVIQADDVRRMQHHPRQEFTHATMGVARGFNVGARSGAPPSAPPSHAVLRGGGGGALWLPAEPGSQARAPRRSAGAPPPAARGAGLVLPELSNSARVSTVALGADPMQGLAVTGSRFRQRSRSMGGRFVQPTVFGMH